MHVNARSSGVGQCEALKKAMFFSSDAQIFVRAITRANNPEQTSSGKQAPIRFGRATPQAISDCESTERESIYSLDLLEWNRRERST